MMHFRSYLKKKKSWTIWWWGRGFGKQVGQCFAISLKVYVEFSNKLLTSAKEILSVEKNIKEDMVFVDLKASSKLEIGGANFFLMKKILRLSIWI